MERLVVTDGRMIVEFLANNFYLYYSLMNYFQISDDSLNGNSFVVA